MVPEPGDVVIAPAGDLDVGAAGEFERGAREAIERVPGARVVLDLSRLEFIDSVGLRVVLGLRNDVIREGRALTAVPGPPPVQRVVSITGTQGLFEWAGGIG